MRPSEFGLPTRQRVDHIAVQLFPEYSRSKLQNWIVSGELTVDGKMRKCKEKLPGGEVIRIQATLEVLQDHQDEYGIAPRIIYLQVFLMHLLCILIDFCCSFEAKY